MNAAMHMAKRPSLIEDVTCTCGAVVKRWQMEGHRKLNTHKVLLRGKRARSKTAGLVTVGKTSAAIIRDEGFKVVTTGERILNDIHGRPVATQNGPFYWVAPEIADMIKHAAEFTSTQGNTTVAHTFRRLSAEHPGRVRPPVDLPPEPGSADAKRKEREERVAQARAKVEKYDHIIERAEKHRAAWQRKLGARERALAGTPKAIDLVRESDPDVEE
jgi:hypothetical protein